LYVTYYVFFVKFQLSQSYVIKWPSVRDMNTTIKKFKQSAGLKNVFGTVC